MAAPLSKTKAAPTRFGGLATALAFKVMLDRYTIHDLSRRFEVGDLALVVAKDEPNQKWLKKGVGTVKALHGDGTMTVVLDETHNPDPDVPLGELRVPTESADRPTERTWAEVANRTGHAIAQVERTAKARRLWGERFAGAIADLRLVPGGRILAGAGTGTALTYLNCYVVPSPRDSRHGIIETLGQMIEIMSRGGGVGINVSSLRPRRAIVRGVNGRSSGAASWMDLYSRATGLVEQGGSRRGALMVQLDDWHPDLLRFIDAKREAGAVENANISVRVSDEFMAAVKHGGEWALRFPDTDFEAYDAEWDGNLPAWEAKGYPVVEHQRLPAREIWSHLTESAWASAEPGIVFSGRHERDSNSQLFNPLICTNPCIAEGEMVPTETGQLPIEQVQAGMSVLTHTGRLRKVLRAGLTRRDADIVTVTAVGRTGEHRLRCTPDHRIFLDNGQYAQAKDCLGEVVRLGGGAAAQVVSVEASGSADVYDLTVEEDHTFVASGIVVHNCAEEPLPAWGVCTLGHVNLAACLHDGGLDMDLLRDTVRTGVRFLDDVVDATPYYFDDNERNQKSERRIGLGTMGLGEVLMRLGLPYGSPDAVEFAERLYREIALAAYEASIDLAAEKGPFPAWNPAILDSGDAFVARMATAFPELEVGLRRHGMRNVTVLTQAPTGTIGVVVDTSTGIEPYYALQYTRQSRLGQTLMGVRPVQEWLDEHGIPAGTKIADIKANLPDHFVGAMDLSPEQHVRMQAAAQRWTDASISKTANAPADFTVEQTRELYELAYDLGCKGVTIYRDHSRDDQVLQRADEAPKAATPTAGPVLAQRPRRMRGECFLVPTHFGNLTLDVHEDPTTGDVVEVIASAGAAGSDLMADAVALGMAVSVLLRLNSQVPKRERIEILADKFRNIGGAKNGMGGLGAAASLAQGIARGLEQYLARDAKAPGVAAPAPADPPAHATGKARGADFDLCPACGTYSMEMVEGCRTCHGCGFSNCS